MTNIESPQKEDPADALIVRSAAADWLVARRMAESWTDADQAGLDAWLAQSPANRIAYWRLDGAWGQANRLTALRQPMRVALTKSKTSTSFRIFRVTAALAVVGAMGIFGIRHTDQSSFRTYTTPVGGHLTIALTDGSKIELNTDSVLRVSAQGSQRRATLERGEAYFQIEHNPQSPFVLLAGGQRITDIGTRFTVRKQAGKLAVTLFEGSARIEVEGAAPQSQSAILLPGDVAVVAGNSISVAKRPIPQLTEALAWRQGMVVFKRATLAEVASEFNRYNGTKIVIADPHVARMTIHGTFPETGVLAFADAAQAYFKLHIEKRDGEVVLSR